MREDAIECPRYGGVRFAAACMHYDRYKVCRRHCPALTAFLREHPNFEGKPRTAPEKGEQLSLFLPAKHSGKHVPRPELACPRCKFVAKSARGLKYHLTRSHKART